MPNLATLFSEAAEREGDRVALITKDERISFKELERRAAAFAVQCYQRGVRKGDTILVAMPIGVSLYVALAACWRLGAVAVFPEPALGLFGLRHAINVAKPKYIFVDKAYRLLKLLPWCWPLPALTPKISDKGDFAPAPLNTLETALISFTSGSTGLPKAIPRSHEFLLAQYRAVKPLLESHNKETDLVAFPVFVLVNLVEGRTSVLPNWKISAPERVTAQALAKWLQVTEATRALLPPSLSETLAFSGIPDSLHTLFTGGGPVKPALIKALKKHKKTLRIVSVYGSTEAEPIAELDWQEVTEAHVQNMQQGDGLLVGKPVSGIEIKTVENEIWVNGEHVNAHYLDARMEAGIKVHEQGKVWHRTGDAGRIDSEGNLWLLGRHSAIVNTENRLLFPFAVELAAENWVGVKRAALTELNGEPVLVLQTKEPVEKFQLQAEKIGISTLLEVKDIPLDKRHRSKIDYPALATRLKRLP